MLGLDFSIKICICISFVIMMYHVRWVSYDDDDMCFRFVIQELYDTEQAYVEDLRCVVDVRQWIGLCGVCCLCVCVCVCVFACECV